VGHPQIKDSSRTGGTRLPTRQAYGTTPPKQKQLEWATNFVADRVTWLLDPPGQLKHNIPETERVQIRVVCMVVPAQKAHHTCS
jgi:hypothetical protein